MTRQNITTILLTLLLSMVGINASAHDIAVANDDEVTIYYVYTNNRTELAVSYRGDDPIDYSNEYAGNVVIPESVTYKGTTYPVTSIGESAFIFCYSLTSVTIPNSVTSINHEAFTSCYSLTSVNIPNSVTSIGEMAFSGCSSLTSVDIPNSVTSIGSWAFSACIGLTSITIPNSVTSIIDYAFAECSGLTSVTIPSSVTSIGQGAFRDCSGLTNVTIPNSVTSIGSEAFFVCSGLTNVTIGNSVKSIGDNAFDDCSGLTSIIVEEGNTVYDSRDNCNAIIETTSNTLIVGCMNTIIPNSVTSIGKSAFYGCSGLTSITIPSSVTSIGEEAFRVSGLRNVTIPNSVTSIGKSAFGHCIVLTSVYCYAESLPTTAFNAFIFSSYNTATLHVPESSIDSYKSATPWSGFGSIVALVDKCATPVITFANGEFSFDSETEGVEFHYAISLIGETAGVGSKVPAASSYRISVYATKDGYEDSDVATMDIDFSTLGDANGDGEITIADITILVNTILGNNGSGNSRMKK